MIDFYKNAKSFMKINTVHTDNNVFKLHYKLTVILLTAFSVLLTSKQYFGDPIDCDVEERKEVIDVFCWTNGTFIIEENLLDNKTPGFGPIKKQATLNWQSYYQWVCIVFALQAILFYLPWFIWKTCEGGRLKLLVGEFGGPLTSEKWNAAAKERLVKHILNDTYGHNVYTFRYCCCEVLNLINVILNIYCMDWFINGQFSRYGIAHATYDLINPMNRNFPKMAKCRYYRYGSSGSLEWRDALCVLPLNVLNQRLFLILWYWLFILLLLTMVCVLYRAVFLFVPVFRVYLLIALARKIEGKKARVIVRKVSFGDFFIIYKIGKNMNYNIYKEIVNSIYDHLMKRDPSYKNFLQDL